MTNGENIIPITARHPLVGIWRPADPEGFAEYTITAEAEGFAVRAVDRHDGEDFVISNVSWDGEVLGFGSLMPSTRWKLENEFRSLGTEEMEHHFKRREVWKRARPPKGKGVLMDTASSFAGAWESPDEDESLVITIRAGGAAFAVGAVDRDDGEVLMISAISWDGSVLRFESLMRSINRQLEHEIRPLGDSQLEHIFAEREKCIRVG